MKQLLILLFTLFVIAIVNGQKKPIEEFRRTSVELLNVPIKPIKNVVSNKSTFLLKKVDQAPGLIYSFNHKDIQNSTANFLIDFLNQIPSFSIISSYGLYRSIAVNGFAMEQGNLSVFLDDMPLTEDFLGDINLGLRIPLHNLESILIAVSPTIVTNGSDAGVCSIWLSSRNPKTSQSINFNLQGGTSDSNFSNGIFDFKNQRKYKNGISYSISGHVLTGDLSNKKTTDFYNNNIDFKTQLFTQSRKLNFNIKYKNFLLSAVNENHDFNNKYIGDHIYTNGYSILSRYDKELNKNTTLQFDFNLNTNRFTDDRRNPVSSMSVFDNIDSTKLFVLNQIGNKEVVSLKANIKGKLKMKLKHDFRINQQLQIRSNNSKIKSIIDKDLNEDTNNFVYGYSLEIDKTFLGINFILGNLLEFSTITKVKALPSFSITIPLPKFVISTGYASYYREPVGITKYLLGNSLDIPTSHMAYLKVKHDIAKDFSIILHSFYNDHQKLNIYNAQTNTFIHDNLAILKRKTVGGTFLINFKRKKLNLNSGYGMYYNLENVMEGSKTELRDISLSPGIPTHKITFDFSYQLRSKIFLLGNYILESPRTNSLNFKNDGLVVFNLPSAQYINIKLRANQFISRLIDVTLGFDNILDKNNYVTSGLLNDPFITPRQSFNISLAFSIDINNI